MNFKKRLKQAICISAAVAVSFTSVYAETTPDPEDYPDTNSVYIEPWQQGIILNLIKSGAEFPTSDVVSNYNLTSTGSLDLSVELVSYTDEDNNTIDVTSTTNVEETIGKHYIDGVQTSYINVPKLTFKTTGTNSSYNTVQNKIECNKVSGTYGFTVNSAGTAGTLNLPNYSCTYSPYAKTELDATHLSTDNLTFEVNQHNITGTNTTNSEIVFDLSINTDGTITGNFSIETVGQSVKSQKTVFSAPYLDITNLTGSSEFSWDNYIQVQRNTDYVFIYDTNGTNADAWVNSISLVRGNETINMSTYFPLTTLKVAKFSTGNNNYYSINYGNFYKNKDLYIYYFGPLSGVPDDLYRYVFGQSQLENLTEHGNTGSQNAVATAATTTTELDTTSTQLHNIDTGYLDQADSAIDALDTSSVDTLLNTNDFVATANWLSTQITNFLGVNNVFSTVVYFSLVLGIILVVLGRMR